MHEALKFRKPCKLADIYVCFGEIQPFNNRRDESVQEAPEIHPSPPQRRVQELGGVNLTLL